MQRKDEDQILTFAQKLEGHTINELKSPYSSNEIREYGGFGPLYCPLECRKGSFKVYPQGLRLSTKKVTVNVL